MKPIMILGIVLLILGAAGLIFGGFTYTTRQDVIKVGDLHVTAPVQKTVNIPLIAGGLVLAGGVAAVVVGARKSA
jgi:hypothetical protein